MFDELEVIYILLYVAPCPTSRILGLDMGKLSLPVLERRGWFAQDLSNLSHMIEDLSHLMG